LLHSLLPHWVLAGHLSAGSSESFTAAWQQDPAAVEQVLEAALRITLSAADESSGSSRAPGVAWNYKTVQQVTTALKRLNNKEALAALLLLATGDSSSSSSTSTALQQQQQQQQQPSAWRTGLLLSCFKALTKALQQDSTHPLCVLQSVTDLALLCPGLGTLAGSANAVCPSPEVAASHEPGSEVQPAAIAAAAAARFEMSSGLPWFLQNCLTTLLHVVPATLRAGSSSSSGGATAAAVREHAAPLALLVGRALHVAATALMQLHNCNGNELCKGQEWPTTITECSLGEVQCSMVLLYCFVAALGPLLEAAAAAAAAAAAGASSSSAAGGSSSAAGMQSIAALQQLQQQLLHSTWMRLSDAYDSVNATFEAGGLDICRGPEVMQGELLGVFPADAVQQMLQLATGVCTQLVSPDTADAVAPLCANPGCTNCSKLSERELVGGKSSVCSGCRMVRLCSAECNTAYCKAGHKQVCKRLRGSKQQQQAGGGGRNSSAAGDTGGSSSKSSSRGSSTAGSSVRRGSSSSMRSSSTGGSQGSSARSSSSGVHVAEAMGCGITAAAVVAAGLELPSSAPAAAALSVRQLKALLAGLGVGCGAAVEKSDLVGALVAHLRLN
jgi:hypothetical protein